MIVVLILGGVDALAGQVRRQGLLFFTEGYGPASTRGRTTATTRFLRRDFGRRASIGVGTYAVVE